MRVKECPYVELTPGMQRDIENKDRLNVAHPELKGLLHPHTAVHISKEGRWFIYDYYNEDVLVNTVKVFGVTTKIKSHVKEEKEEIE